MDLKMENVKIACKCFTISYKERDDGLLRITNCPIVQISVNWILEVEVLMISNVLSCRM